MKTVKVMVPITGISEMRIHHPLLFVSCKRRIETAKVGMNTARLYNKLTIPWLPKKASTMPITKEMTRLNRMKIQYSLLLALPLNTAYYFRAFM